MVRLSAVVWVGEGDVVEGEVSWRRALGVGLVERCLGEEMVLT